MNALPARVAVATSGGRDSTALLHCTVHAAAALGVQVIALHVHHGLVAAADGWVDHVRRQAQRWGAAFEFRRLAGAPAAGESIEAWARRGRYAALADMAGAAGCPLVLLAHHRRDQAETWLLQALRGAGPAGLAAMPVQAARLGLTWARPWLDQPRSAIESYVRRHRLRHVDDPSNEDARLARNRLRLQVWPALTGAFADAEVALAASARRAAEADELAREVAQADLPALCDGQALLLPAWLALPPARRRNALRAWLRGALGQAPPDTLTSRLLQELPLCRAGRWPAGASELRLHRGRLQRVPGPAALVPGDAAPAVPAPAACSSLDLDRAGTVPVPGWAGRLVVEAAQEGGAPPGLLRRLVARPRSGGERFRLAAASLPRSLKKQYQAAGVPAWERDGPLLYLPDGRLLFVPGLGIDAALRAAPGETQLVLAWRPGPPGTRQPAG